MHLKIMADFKTTLDVLSPNKKNYRQLPRAYEPLRICEAQLERFVLHWNVIVSQFTFEDYLLLSPCEMREIFFALFSTISVKDFCRKSQALLSVVQYAE